MSEMIEIAGLWKNKSKDGKVYLSGYFGNAKVLVFPNSHKQEGEKSPDYRMYVAPKAEKPKEAVPPTQPETDIDW
jgi:uncharacterized protein (DUF736 family)